MDKASIVGDAIDYLRELKKEMKDIETEIAELEQKCSKSMGVEDATAAASAARLINHVDLGSTVNNSSHTIINGGSSEAADAAAHTTSDLKNGTRVTRKKLTSLSTIEALSAAKLAETLLDVSHLLHMFKNLIYLKNSASRLCLGMCASLSRTKFMLRKLCLVI
jgi:hypothetical protein